MSGTVPSPTPIGGISGDSIKVTETPLRFSSSLPIWFAASQPAVPPPKIATFFISINHQ